MHYYPKELASCMLNEVWKSENVRKKELLLELNKYLFSGKLLEKIKKDLRNNYLLRLEISEYANFPFSEDIYLKEGKKIWEPGKDRYLRHLGQDISDIGKFYSGKNFYLYNSGGAFFFLLFRTKIKEGEKEKKVNLVKEEEVEKRFILKWIRKIF